MVDSASKILVTGGVVVLLYSLLLGFPLAAIRGRSAQAPRFLVLAHVGGISQGVVLIALTFAVALSDLSTGLETVAAWLAVAGAAMVATGDTLNWLQNVGDPFQAKPAGFRFQSVGAPLVVAAVVILLIGIIKGL